MRIKREEDIQEDRMRRFFQLREEQAEIRKQYVDKVKKDMFSTRGCARDINTAYVMSEVAYEQEKQRQFKKFIQDHENADAALYAERVREDVRKDAEEKAEVKRKLCESKLVRGEYLRKIIEENQLKEKIANDIRFKKECIDNEKAVKEMKLIQNHEMEEMRLEKRQLLLDREKQLADLREVKKQLAQEEKEKDEVVAIYQQAKQEIDCLREITIVERRQAIMNYREDMGKMLPKVADKIAVEEKLHEAAVIQQEAE